MDIQLPDLGNFTIAPRLVECSRLTLSSGALFPVQSPYSEEWGVTTLAAILESLVGNLSDSYSGGGGVGHRHNNMEVLDALSEFNGYLHLLDIFQKTARLAGRFSARILPMWQRS